MSLSVLDLAHRLRDLLCQVHVLPHQGADEECGARF
jgi:hypothetical protein